MCKDNDVFRRHTLYTLYSIPYSMKARPYLKNGIIISAQIVLKFSPLSPYHKTFI